HGLAPRFIESAAWLGELHVPVAQNPALALPVCFADRTAGEPCALPLPGIHGSIRGSGPVLCGRADRRLAPQGAPDSPISAAGHDVHDDERGPLDRLLSLASKWTERGVETNRAKAWRQEGICDAGAHHAASGGPELGRGHSGYHFPDLVALRDRTAQSLVSRPDGLSRRRLGRRVVV